MYHTKITWDVSSGTKFLFRWNVVRFSPKEKKKKNEDEVLWGNMIDCHLTFAHIERP